MNEWDFVPDELISGPLWYWPPGQRLAVLSERRRRFGYCLNDLEEESF